MQAGLLRDIVELQKSTITISANSGEQVRTWATTWRGRARVDFTSGTQLVTNNETFNRVTRKVTIRTKPVWSGKLSEYRLKIEGDYYNILSRDVRRQDMATIMLVELIND